MALGPGPLRPIGSSQISGKSRGIQWLQRLDPAADHSGPLPGLFLLPDPQGGHSGWLAGLVLRLSADVGGVVAGAVFVGREVEEVKRVRFKPCSQIRNKSLFQLTPSPEYRLLQQAIQLGTPAQAMLEAQHLLMEQPIDWTFFLDMAENHAIRPQVASMLNQLSKELVPAGVIAQLKEVRQKLAFQQMANAAEFLHIQKLLQAEGITAVPYKGFWLGYTAYGDLGEREGRDIDVLFAPQDLGSLQKIMFARGYQTEQGSLGDNARAVLDYHGEYNFDKFSGTERLYLFEFHASASNQKLGFKIGLPDLQEQIQTAFFKGQPIRVFSPSAQLYLAVVHHGAKDAWLSLKFVLDVAKLLQRYGDQLDWPWLLAINKRFDTTGLFWVGLGLAQSLCGIAVPIEVQAELDRTKIKRLVKTRKRALFATSTYGERSYWMNVQRLWFLLNTQEYWGHRWTLFRNQLKPIPVFDQKKRIQTWWVTRFLSRILKIAWNIVKEKNNP